MIGDLTMLATPWRSDLLASLAGVTHGLSRRVPGMGLAEGNIGFSAPRDRQDAWDMRQRWCAAIGFAADHVVTLGQVHGATVHKAGAVHAGWGATPGSTQIGLGDALITDAPGPVLMTLHADCQPLLFVDPGHGRRGPAVGVAHAGWRGTVADVAGATLSAMVGAFGTRVEDVHVALGPAIGSCCYAVGAEVVAAWRDRAGTDADAALATSGDQCRLSLSAANLVLLARAGVRPERIEVSDICTRCRGESWFSHRGQGPHTGRFGAMIAIGA
jgi:YfiH family protein